MSTGQSVGRCNIFDLSCSLKSAHDGTGLIDVARVSEHIKVGDSCKFMDYVEMAAGTSIGDHRHTFDEEELYLILGGTGVMRLENETFPVAAGDLVRNAPGGLHGLVNSGTERLRLFVLMLAVHPDGHRTLP